MLTPHAGELARLLGEESEWVNAHRLEAATRGAERFGCICLLKGADTIIAAPGEGASVCVVDAPGLATAGTGDVLTGILAAFLAKGVEPRFAAAAAATAHGLAARAAGRQAGLIASDVDRGASVRARKWTSSLAPFRSPAGRDRGRAARPRTEGADAHPPRTQPATRSPTRIERAELQFRDEAALRVRSSESTRSSTRLGSASLTGRTTFDRAVDNTRLLVRAPQCCRRPAHRPRSASRIPHSRVFRRRTCAAKAEVERDVAGSGLRTRSCVRRSSSARATSSSTTSRGVSAAARSSRSRWRRDCMRAAHLGRGHRDDLRGRRRRRGERRPRRGRPGDQMSYEELVRLRGHAARRSRRRGSRTGRRAPGASPLARATRVPSVVTCCSYADGASRACGRACSFRFRRASCAGARASGRGWRPTARSARPRLRLGARAQLPSVTIR
mgnify:CR=1 FL=1